MPFLSPNQQCQSTEVTVRHVIVWKYISHGKTFIQMADTLHVYSITPFVRSHRSMHAYAWVSMVRIFSTGL